MIVLNTGALGPATRIRRFEGPILRMRNARQSGAASHSARVSKHQTQTTLDGERVKSGNLRGAGVSSSVLELQFANRQCEAVRRHIPLYSGPQAPRRGRPVRRQHLMRVHAFGPALRTRRIEGPNLRMRNGRRSATAYRSTRVPQHQVGL